MFDERSDMLREDEECLCGLGKCIGFSLYENRKLTCNPIYRRLFRFLSPLAAFEKMVRCDEKAPDQIA